MELITCVLCKSAIYWAGYDKRWLEEDATTEHTLFRCQTIRERNVI